MRLSLRFVSLFCLLLASCGSPVVGGDAYCPGGQTACGEACFDLTSTREHCGACDNACAPGEVCSEGVCAISCPGTQTACDGGCHDVSSSPEHCGSCGNACAAGEVCSDGACASSCAPGEIECDGRCVDPTSNPTHCGGCASAGPDAGVGGRTCASGEACVDGLCQGACPAGQIMCGAFCVDPLTDRAHCGASGDCLGASAGAMCASGEICVGGSCETSCPVGQEVCGDFCVFLDRDPENCGVCSNVCPMPPSAFRVCVSGMCDFVCETGFEDCDRDAVNGCEVMLTSDPANCGACGNACPDLPASAPTCSAGVCGFVCDDPTSLDDCNTDPTDGCETDVTSTLAHCGACGNACPTPANASPTCASGTCGFTCNTGFADCDGDPANGCEVELATDPSHCGTCGNVCSTGMCTSGVCGGACYTGPARVLVYGPGGTAGSAMFPPGTSVTVASEAMWRSMTTAQFAQYDVLWMDGNSCAGTLDSVFGAAEDTLAAWGPAVQGRVVLVTGDPDLHGGSMAQRFYQNSVGWLKEMGRTSDGGRTSLFISWGCTLFNSPYTPGLRGSPERFGTVLGAPIAGANVNYCAAATTTAGTSHPVMAGVTSYWGCPTHGAFSSTPSSYTILATGGSAGPMPVIIARDSAVACIPVP